MNLNKDPSSWARVAPEAVLHGSEAMRANVINMAIEDIGKQAAEIERLRDGLDAAIRAAKLALFVINKQGVMPNSSWESGFKSDLDKATAARSAL